MIKKQTWFVVILLTAMCSAPVAHIAASVLWHVHCMIVATKVGGSYEDMTNTHDEFSELAWWLTQFPMSEEVTHDPRDVSRSETHGDAAGR